MRQLKITNSITNREDKSLERYLNDISKEDMITMEEEIELTRKIKQGDQEALDRMVRSNLRFVISAAKQYQGLGLPLVDLISEGNVGLIKAAKKFDETRGFKFISYAVWWIRQSILDALSEKSRIIRIPLNQVNTLSKINKAFSKLEQDLGREPSLEEIAQVLDLPEDKVKGTIYSSRNHISYDVPIGGETENSSMLDVIKDKESLSTDFISEKESLTTDIERALDILDPKSKDIIKLIYGIGQPYPISTEEIGIKYSISKERVRQIKEKSIKRLRSQPSSRILKSYL